MALKVPKWSFRRYGRQTIAVYARRVVLVCNVVLPALGAWQLIDAVRPAVLFTAGLVLAIRQAAVYVWNRNSS